MKTLFLFPTPMEAQPFKELCPDADIVIIGVGMAAAAASSAYAIAERKPDRVVLCGIAGAMGDDVAVGTVVEVLRDRVAGLPKAFDKEYISPARTLRLSVHSLTVSRTGEGAPYAEQGCPTIEQMEGAAVAAVAEAFGVEYMHLRAISNRVSDDRKAWRIGEAIQALGKELSQLFTE